MKGCILELIIVTRPLKYYKFFYFVEFKKVYDRLGVTIVERGESYYHKMMPNIVQELDDKSE